MGQLLNIFLATITGTVGRQALSRGKKVICFGDAAYAHLKGVRKVTSVADLSFLDKHHVHDHIHAKTSFLDDEHEVLKHSFGIQSQRKIDHETISNRDERNENQCAVLLKWLRNEGLME